MHILDGILSIQWSIIWYAVAAVFVAVGTWQITKRRAENPAYLSILALMGAAVFVISVWHIPLPSGTSAHACGTALAAILVGPFATSVITGISLFFQVFLGHGGITTLGANDVSLGIVGGFVGFFIYLALRKVHLPFWLAAGISGLIGDLTTYATTALQLALSLHPEAVAPNWTIYMIGFLPAQIPISIIEFGFTAAAIQYIATHRPELLKWRNKIG